MNICVLQLVLLLILVSGCSSPESSYNPATPVAVRDYVSKEPYRPTPHVQEWFPWSEGAGLNKPFKPFEVPESSLGPSRSTPSLSTLYPYIRRPRT